MKITDLDWDDENVRHIEGHLVTPTEVEDVCFETHIAYSGRFNRYILYGQTRTGRYIKLVLMKLYRTVFRPITAFDMSEREKKAYRKKCK